MTRRFCGCEGCLLLLAGAYSLLLFATLPPAGWFLVAAFIALILAGSGKAARTACFVAGMAWMGLHSGAVLSDRLSVALDGRDVHFVARVEDFVPADGATATFYVIPLARPDLPRRLRLTWFEPERRPSYGETWAFEARLRRPRGNHNPGGFDFEGWTFRNRIGGTGYVAENSRTYRIAGASTPPASRLRRAVVRRIEGRLPQDDATAVLLAIAAGARHRITDSQWERFAATGTSHLMAISGLHIGLAGLFAYLVGRILAAPLRRLASPLGVATLSGFAGASAYAALSGFAVPARRALLMSAAGATALLLRRPLAPGDVLAAAAVVVFVAEPTALLAPGFALSFGAVAVLLAAARPLRVVSPTLRACPVLQRFVTAIIALGSIQIALLAGLFPLTAIHFGRVSLVAPLINLLVVPLFSIVAVPAALLGLLLTGPAAVAGDALLRLAHDVITLALELVALAARPRMAGVHLASPPLVLLWLPVALVLLPAGWPARRIAILAIVAAVLYRPPPLPSGCFRYDVLDVGQGLATVVATRGYTMLFDTGAAYRGGGSAADSVIVPALRSAGIERIDDLVVSHGDLDHSGGAGRVARATTVGRVLVSEFLDFPGGPQLRCSAGQRWRRDGVRFRVLHPRRGAPWSRNNRSCVIEVAAGDTRLLLTADIESQAEILLAWRGEWRQADAVVVPHHGSRTSSTPALVRTTAPTVAVVSSGYGNRWGFPASDVVTRWRATGASVLNTADAGAISQTLCRRGPVTEPVTSRRARRRFWHEP